MSYKLDRIPGPRIVVPIHHSNDPLAARASEPRRLTRTEVWNMIEAMYGMGVDTLKAVRALEKAGFDPTQAEALVTALGGGIAGNAATKEDLSNLEGGMREENRLLRSELREEIAELRTEMRAGFVAVRAEIAELREETRVEFVAVREEMRTEFAAVRKEMRTEFAAVRKEMDVMKADIADLKTEIVKVRSSCHDDIKSLKAHMYGLLLAQATLIVGLIVGLQRLL